MHSLIALAADFYWEQDGECRFTKLQGTGMPSSLAPDVVQDAVGKAPWEIGVIASGTGACRSLQDVVARREPYRDLEWSWQAGSAPARFFSISGEPVFDEAGCFTHYRGVMRDITAQKHQENELRRFRAAMDMSGSAICLIDRETMRLADINEAACRLTGYARDELLTIRPEDLLVSDRQSLERDYDHVIANGGQPVVSEATGRSGRGSLHQFELQRHAIRFDERWFVVSMARDITSRKKAEATALRLSRMYAAISGTNEAILHAQTPECLFRQVCEVAVSGGQIVSASVLLPDADAEWATVAAVAGLGAETLRSIRISLNEDRAEGRGLVGIAFRSRKPCVSNDLVNDPRLKPWRDAADKEHAASGAALPLIRNDQSVGVLLLYSREKDAFDEEVVKLLERMAQNIAFSLDNFEREIEKQKAVNALRESEEKYRSILENMNDGYFEIDLKGSYTFVNAAICRLHRCTKEEAIGLNYRNYTEPDTAAAVFKVFNQVYRTGAPGELTEYPVWRQDGTRCIAQTSMQLIVNASGEPVGFRGISRDVTAMRQANEALRASEEKYRSILESIEEAYYEVDVAGCLLLCNDAFCRMFGYSLSEVIGMNYRDCHIPEDAAYVFENFLEVYKTGTPKKGIDWRLLHKAGYRVMCEGSIHLVRNASGEPIGFRGMLRDVTTRREMDAALRASEERFRDLTNLSSDWYWEQDAIYRFVQINGDVFGKTGMAVEDYLGKTLWELPFDNISTDEWTEHQGQLAEGLPFYELVLRTSAADGSLRYLSISGLPVKDSEGCLIGYRGTGKDITERKVAEERIRHLASHDILTGLPNRMMFNQMLSYSVQQARRHNRKFAVMFIDLDHFKAINDHFGHDAGDLLLKETAKRLTQSIRASDFVARLAGDEFVVIIQDFEETEHLKTIARKVVVAVRSSVSLAGAAQRVTASVGIAVFPNDGQDEDALMKHADAAMYGVKRSSKNDFQFYLAEA